MDEAREEGLLELIDEVMRARDEGNELDLVALRERAGDAWGELEACLGIVEGLGATARLFEEGVDDGAPEAIGRYRILRLLGEGGFSKVYLALDPRLQRLVAIKLLSLVGRTQRSARDWLGQEAEALARIRHENVVHVHELDEEDGRAYAVMEYVAGCSLGRVLEGLRGGETGAPVEQFLAKAVEGLRPIDARVELAARVAEALVACHAQGVLHRDLNPSNILLAPQCNPKVIDFGLSHLSARDSSASVTEALVGTYSYLAPEQIEAGQTGAEESSDVFSLGVVLYELFTLTHPFLAPSREKTLSAIALAAAVDPRKQCPGLPRELGWIVLRALRRRPVDRYASMAELAADLRAYQSAEPLRAHAPTVRTTVQRIVRRHHASLRAAGLGIALVLLLISGSEWRRTTAVEGALVARAEELRAALPDVDDPRGIRAGVEWLAEARPRLSEVDPDWQTSGAAGAAAGAVRRLEEGLRSRARELVCRVTEAACSEFTASRRDDEIRQAEAEWAYLIETLWPDPELPGALSPMGCRLEVPDGARVWRLRETDAIGEATFVPVSPAGFLPAGTYRVMAADRSWDTTVSLLPRQRIWRVVPEAPSPLLSFEPVGGADPEAASAGDPQTWPLAMVREPVTWRSLLGMEGLKEIEQFVGAVRRDADLDHPAWMPRQLAEDCCSRLGARLPLPAELRRAAEAGWFDAPEPWDSRGVKHVWVLSPDESGYQLWASIESLRARDFEEGRLTVSRHRGVANLTALVLATSALGD